MSKSIFIRASVAAILFAGMSTSVVAGSLAAAEPETAVIVPEVAAAAPFRSFPAVFGAASAVAGPSGVKSVSLSYATPRGGIAGSVADGDMSLGYTFGNAQRNLSVTVVANINSLEDEFGDAGNFSVSASRLVKVGPRSATFIGASVGKVGAWGDFSDEDETYSAQISSLMAFDTARGEFPVQVTAGYGNQTTLSDDGLGTIDEGFFVGAGVGLTEALSVSVSGTETQLNAGATVVVPGIKGVAVTAGMYDITENAERQQVSLSVGYSF